jgi:hypothetical protein
VYWVISAANAYAMFLLARFLTRDTLAALLAGAAFGFCPFLITRAIEHLSLATAFALPLFLLLLLKALEARSFVYAAGAGAALAAAVLSDPYYAVFAVLMGLYVVAVSLVRVDRTATPLGPRVARVRQGIDVALAGGAIWVAVGLARSRSLYTPVLVVVLLVALRLLLVARPRLSWKEGLDGRRLLGLLAAAAGTTAVACLPVLLELGGSFVSGNYVEPDVHWRSSPPGVDLLALLLPNPNHALWEWPWLATLPNGFVENVASLSLVTLLVIAAAVVLDRGALPRLWTGFTLLFTWLALGPFIHVAGANTYLPTPWSVLRFVPVVANARSPSRLAVVVALGTAVLFAFALRALFARLGRRAVLALAVGAALLFELAPAERELHPADIPSFYAKIAADPRPVSVLELPYGVRSGASNVGDFSAYTMFCQTAHGKPIVGGYLSRVSDRHERAYRRNKMADALLRLSAGETLTPEAAEAARRDRKELLESTHLGYVVIDKRRWTDRAHRFVVLALHLQEAGADGPFDLYAVPE